MFDVRCLTSMNYKLEHVGHVRNKYVWGLVILKHCVVFDHKGTGQESMEIGESREQGNTASLYIYIY